MFSNLSVDNSKGKTQLSLRLDGLTMTSSHLLKLDSPTSHVSTIHNIIVYLIIIFLVSATSFSQCCVYHEH